MFLVFSLILILLCGCGQIESLHQADKQDSSRVLAAATKQVKAFPGAIGFGAEATGGRGGRVIHVRNTNDSGPGSLRAAIKASGPRIVVFDVGGLISLKSPLALENGDITIAGQTAPGNGIALRGSRLRVESSNVIIRGMRFRPGDQDFGDRSYENRDGISIGKGTRLIENVIVDSSSMSWSIDELASVWGNVQKMTYSNNIIAEPLRNSKHPKGEHAMGMVVGGKSGDAGPGKITVARNLFSNGRFRCPLVKDTSSFEFINNYCFGFFHTVETGSNLKAHFIKNFLHLTKNSRDREPIRVAGGNTKMYLKGNLDNIYRTSESYEESEIAGGDLSNVTSSPIFPSSGTPEIAVSQLRSHVFNNAGARWPSRDNTDKRIINDVKNEVARYIDSQEDVGGYDNYPKGQAPVDSDGDGMPDSFEKSHGMNPNRDDASNDHNGNGYTNIEEYINALIDGNTIEGPGDPVEEDDPSQNEDEGSENQNLIRMMVEAEDLEILDGFSIQSSGSASNGKWLQSKNEAQAQLTFDGPSGVYNLDVVYFDENDGESQMAVYLNDQRVDLWTWDKDFGTRLAGVEAQTSRRIENLVLNTGDVITLSGRGDGGEPLRTDYLVLDQTDSLTEVPDYVEVDPFSIEAEDLDLQGDYSVKSNGGAQGDYFIQTSNRGSGSASFEYQGELTKMDLTLNFYDENDGVSEYKILIDGKEVLQFRTDKDLGHRLANSQTLDSRTLSDLELKKGTKVEIQCQSGDAEPCRLDWIDFK